MMRKRLFTVRLLFATIARNCGLWYISATCNRETHLLTGLGILGSFCFEGSKSEIILVYQLSLSQDGFK